MISRDPPIPISYIKQSGGIFRDTCIHQLDYAWHFLGERPLTVVAFGNTTSQRADGYRECNDVDLSTIILTFPSGAIAIIETSREATYGFDQRLEVLGSKALAMCENILLSISKMMLASETIQDGCPDSFTRFPRSYVVEANIFLDIVQDNDSRTSLRNGNTPMNQGRIDVSSNGGGRKAGHP
ncbi:inositol 2-dehydrogenase-like [Gigantopelta aegis]|uniref:inositol 2-dehydrogenase-like n=1 Tax=Gigantopelta aegis TaxID=1735272 RepID=UPI001B88CBE7|nr:inositol 2-dehydrogenase-like [Gigantopelta aegis]XP_041367454.1 inositol 2-dehydrogenase-like [Gigantopelta aegis]